MLSRLNLHPYQNKVVNFIKEKRRCALFLDMGMGKTTSTLTSISDILDGCGASKVLIIAPLRVANSVWQQETKLWEHLKDLRISVVTGSDKERREALRQKADIYIINRENVPWLVTLCGKQWPFDFVVVDESSSFKNAASKRFKALKKILKFTEYMVLLTGTPSPQGLGDLWSQMFLLDSGEALGKTLTAFRTEYFTQDYFGHSYTPKPEADKKIHEKIKHLCMSMSAEDYLTLPEKILITEKVFLPEKILKQYKEFEKDLLLEFEGVELEAMSAATLANKLLQWCNGAIYHGEEKEWVEIHNEKIKCLKDIVEDNPNENMLVAYNYKHDLARLTKAFPEAVVLDKDPKTIERWNKGEIRMLLAHPMGCGHGLNIQRGGSILVWFGLTYSLEAYGQMNARLYRQLQEKSVRIVHIVADSCLDERVMKVLTQKDLTQKNLLDALKNVDFEI